MVRPPSFDRNGIKKGAWSKEEDDKLRAYVQRYGHWNWRLLPKYAGLARCGKSCRLRWVNYLKPGLKRGEFSKQEEDLVIQLHEQFGNKWSAIAAKLPGRTDNEIKNLWHTRLDKHRKRRPPSAPASTSAPKASSRGKATVLKEDHKHSEADNNNLIKQLQHNSFDAAAEAALSTVDTETAASTLLSSFDVAAEAAPSTVDTETAASPLLSSFDADKPASHELPLTAAVANVEMWPDMFLPDANYPPNECFPQLEEDYQYNSRFHTEFVYSELSSSDTTYLTAPDHWMGDDDGMSSGAVSSSDFWGSTGDSFDCLREIPTYGGGKQVEEFYDTLLPLSFDHGMKLAGSDI